MKEFKWYWMESFYDLYLLTQEEGFWERPDAEEIIQYLKDAENIRPEDLM